LIRQIICAIILGIIGAVFLDVLGFLIFGTIGLLAGYIILAKVKGTEQKLNSEIKL